MGGWGGSLAYTRISYQNDKMLFASGIQNEEVSKHAKYLKLERTQIMKGLGCCGEIEIKARIARARHQSSIILLLKPLGTTQSEKTGLDLEQPGRLGGTSQPFTMRWRR